MDATTILKDALLELRRLRARNQELEARATEPVAVVGMACRYPGGISGPEGLWTALRNGLDAVSEVPAARWDVDAHYDPDPDAPGKSYCRHGAFLDDVTGFDPVFFGMSPREAASVDPQQRLLLELAWEAIEHAGHDAHSLRRQRVGIFVGVGSDDYAHLTLRDMSRLDIYAGTGTSRSMAAGRLAYVLGVNGPALQVDTSCSSSLVALHLAAASLRSGECDAALAGGVHLLLSPLSLVMRAKLRALSANGRCRTFDAAADGFVPGEGGGLVLLKRASDAARDRDRVMAEIVGSDVNHDGQSSGLTAPSQRAQKAVIERALERAGAHPDEIGYLEAHGTGTQLGDPVEISALRAVFGGRSAERPLRLGSAKTNFGHLEAAAGILSFSKVVLSLERGLLPPHLHLTRPNPHVAWGELPFEIPVQPTPWNDLRRLASVSAFGMSGTNCHVVARYAAEPSLPSRGRAVQLWTISTRSRPALSTLAAQHAEVLRASPEKLADLAFTANAGRAAFAHRLAVVAGSANDIAQQLESFARGESAPLLRSATLAPASSPLPLVFVLGDGKVTPNCGRALYESFPAFAEELHRLAALADGYRVDLIAALYGDRGSALEDARAQHVARVALHHAVTALWRQLGVVPAVATGEGAGGVAAASIEGRMSILAALDPDAPRRQPPPFEGATGHAGSGDPTLNAALRALVDRGYRAFLELGTPGREDPARDVRGDLLANQGSWFAARAEAQDELMGFLDQAAQLFLAGYPLEWHRLEPAQGPLRARLPTYPFERRSCHRLSQLPSSIGAPKPSASMHSDRILEHVAIPMIAATQVASDGGRRAGSRLDSLAEEIESTIEVLSRHARAQTHPR